MSCCDSKVKFDWVFWVSFFGVLGLYVWELIGKGGVMSGAVYEFVNVIWWGILVGVLSMSMLGRVPRRLVVGVMGRKKGLRGVLRAVLGGVLLDVCSHGVLMVGAKLYERGVSVGQVIAFLVASPWNSLSLTVILVGLIGLWWTLLFIVLSMIIAVITGLIFEWLEGRGILRGNPNEIELEAGFDFWSELGEWWRGLSWGRNDILRMFRDGIRESKMVVKWVLFGVLLAALIRVFMDEGSMSVYFGPSLMGLGLTVIMATILEVCSEGTAPVAGDLLVRAGAPGNSFAFLMAGVATDYTEMMVLREVTGSWRIALMLPVVTLPQVLVLGWLMNVYGG